MRDLLLATVVFGLLPFVLKRPFWGILLMAWLGYMNPHRLAYGFMLSFPVVQVVVIFTLIGMLVSKEAKRMVWSREIIVLVIFIIWMGLTTSLAMFYDAAVEQYTKVIKIQILTFMTLLMLTSKERVHQFVWVMALSLMFYGVKGGLFTIANAGSYRVQGPPGTFIGGNNELALALVMTIPLMRFLQLQAKRHAVRLALTIAMLLTAVSAVGSQSRGALVALLLTGAIFWAKGRNKAPTAILMVIVAAGVLTLMPDAWFERMNTIKTYDEDDSALGRINAWWMAWNVANARIVGGGFEMFKPSTFSLYAPEPFRVHDSHSIYFEVLGEHGFIGLFLFLLLLTFTWMKCGAIRRMAKSDAQASWARDLASMIQVSMVAYMVGGAFLGLAYFDYIYHLVALTVVTHHLIQTPAPTPRPLAATRAHRGPAI
jgi:probable O-glycosylation ligase (exosortase A-associated)